MKKYTFMRMNPETHQEIKILAAQKNTTIIDLMKELLENYKENKQHKEEVENDRI